IIVNHALYFADLGLRSRTEAPAVLPEHDAVVFDEAHRLEECAAAWLGGRISGPVLYRLVRRADPARPGASPPAPTRAPGPGGALDRVEGAGRRLLAAVSPPAGRRRLREMPPGPVEALETGLLDLAAALDGGRDELDAVAGRALRLAADAAACLEPDENRVV